MGLYLYTINFTIDEESLCNMEMKSLFQSAPDRKYFFSQNDVGVSRSPFIKQRLAVSIIGKSLEDLTSQIESQRIHYDDFKVKYVETEERMGVRDRLHIEHVVGGIVFGDAQMRNPKITLGVSMVEGKWVFGEYEKNAAQWLTHNDKPYSYSTALNTRVARALVNIAVCGNLESKVVDPCCGIGTVVIEALSMGVDIRGFDFNAQVIEHAKSNLKHFGYENAVEAIDIHDLSETFDVAIIDLPYGVFTKSTLEEQVAIIDSARKITDKLVLVSIVDMDEYIRRANFQIIDKCHADKGKFRRYITICE